MHHLHDVITGAIRDVAGGRLCAAADPSHACEALPHGRRGRTDGLRAPDIEGSRAGTGGAAARRASGRARGFMLFVPQI